MEALYVCLFSNGVVKVGRSINPSMRVAQHADRVACFGITLERWRSVQCTDNVEQREALLIERCVAQASNRHNHEWFEGLDFEEACIWSADLATAALPDKESVTPGASRWSVLIAEFRARGWTFNRLGDACGCNSGTIRHLHSGYAREPLHSLGEKLLALHRERIASAIATELQAGPADSQSGGDSAAPG